MQQLRPAATQETERLDEVRRTFQPYAPYELTEADAAEIDTTIRGFYAVLTKWKRWSREKRANGGVHPTVDGAMSVGRAVVVTAPSGAPALRPDAFDVDRANVTGRTNR
jgi:hypothetical protein